MKLDLLAIGAHPDDVELSCGGTLALASRHGRRVGIVHLTRGEMGTRGTAEERRTEAERAAEILGATELVILDCGDGGLRTGPAEEDHVIELIRSFRPEVVLAPPPQDRHPDHGRAHRLVTAACFYAGVGRRRLTTPGGRHLEPHRPGAVFHFMQHDLFDPTFVIDVTEVWQVRQRAVSAYHSQIFQDDEDDRDEPPTKIASEDFWYAIEGRARHFGNAIGATFGEPFGSRVPLSVRDLLDLVPREGVR